MGFFTQLIFHPVAWYRAHQLLVGQTGVNGLLAFSIWLTLYSGQLTLANAGFMAIGAFTAVILTGGTTSTGHAAVGLARAATSRRSSPECCWPAWSASSSGYRCCG